MASLLMLMQFLSPDTEFWEIPVFEVNNQHILVTGGSIGLGRHFAHFLASNGAKVTLAARRADALASAERKALCSTSHWATGLMEQ